MGAPFTGFGVGVGGGGQVRDSVFAFSGYRLLWAPFTGFGVGVGGGVGGGGGQVRDSVFAFSGYRQAVAPIAEGAFADFDLLTVRRAAAARRTARWDEGSDGR